jgi:glutamate synthase (NADPH/NADH) large chain
MAARSARRWTATACAPRASCVTDDDLVVMASESGVLPIKEDNIVRKWRLQPGRMLLIDFEQGRIIEDEELKAQLGRRAAL